LRVGDRLSSHDGRWVAVEGLQDTGECERVYNLRVAEYHTYFVGRVRSLPCHHYEAFFAAGGRS